jgi:anthranilate phosphoribosyltransferase
MIVGKILDRLADKHDLGPEEASELFEALFTGGLTPAQSGALLLALRMKGESAVELSAAVRAGLGQARLVPGLSGRRIDTCGTGGDNKCSFNCSTAVSLVLAGMGYKVVKHGNRAISSRCGSADVLETLGLPITLGPEDASAELSRRNFVFLFAPNYHPAFRHVMPVRKELGCRTLFNLMGPLLNPARPTHQILGVPPKSLQDMVTLNLGVAIYLLEDNLPLELAMEMAQAKVEQGLVHGGVPCLRNSAWPRKRKSGISCACATPGMCTRLGAAPVRVSARL